MKILILGSTGMLGHMVKKYLEQFFEIQTLNGYWPEEEYKKKIQESEADFLINCVGAIPQRTKTFSVNYELPIFLEENFKGKIIYPGTDCEMDEEDEYGLSKRNAKEYIISKGSHTKIIKSSIIGPEVKTKASLLEWFLNAEGSVNGYTKAMWSGVTTLQWAKICKNVIENWDSYQVENILESTCLSKFDLLVLFKILFNKDIEIIPNNNFSKNRCLVGTIKVPSILKQLVELKEFYYGN